MTNRTNRPKEDRANRPRRPFVGDTPDILTVEGKDPEFVYRWVNDTPGRVARMLEAGYEVVEDTHEVAAAAEQISGANNTLLVDKRNGIHGILMRIPKEWYDEDRRKFAERVDRSEDAMYRKERETDGRYGTLENFRD